MWMHPICFHWLFCPMQTWKLLFMDENFLCWCCFFFFFSFAVVFPWLSFITMWSGALFPSASSLILLWLMMFTVSLLQGKSVSLTNFFRIARNTMTMCFNKEPGAAEVEVSVQTSLLNCGSQNDLLVACRQIYDISCQMKDHLKPVPCFSCILLLMIFHLFFLASSFCSPPVARVLEDCGAERQARGSALWEGGHQYTWQWFPHRKVRAIFKVSRPQTSHNTPSCLDWMSECLLMVTVYFFFGGGGLEKKMTISLFLT